jgi:hypothetical protein
LNGRLMLCGALLLGTSLSCVAAVRSPAVHVRERPPSRPLTAAEMSQVRTVPLNYGMPPVVVPPAGGLRPIAPRPPSRPMTPAERAYQGGLRL